MNSKKIKINMAVSFLSKPLSMIISYIYVPLSLSYLGIEKYGVWTTIMTILSWISYFDIGIGNGLRNKLTESLNSKDGKSRTLVSSAYVFISMIMIVVSIVFCGASIFINWNKVLGASNIDENLMIIVVTSVLFLALNFILQICKNILYALQKSGYVSIMELCVQSINLIGIIIIMNVFQGGLLALAILYGLSMIIVNLVFSIVLFSKHKECRPSFGCVDIKVGKSLTNIGMQFFIIQICALVLFSTDNLIISYIYGASNVTPYSIVNKLFTLISSFFIALLAPIWSAVTKAMASNKCESCFFNKHSIVCNRASHQQNNYY